LGLSIIAGLSITILLGVVNNLAFRAGYYCLSNVPFKIALWSWPIFGAFFDIVAPSKHLSRFSPHPGGGYAALFLTVVLFSLISYAILWLASRRRSNENDPLPFFQVLVHF
jgi:hypothetical protein